MGIFKLEILHQNAPTKSCITVARLATVMQDFNNLVSRLKDSDSLNVHIRVGNHR